MKPEGGAWNDLNYSVPRAISKTENGGGLGADAVYLAGERFGMWTASKNFTPEQLQEGIRYAHERG